MAKTLDVLSEYRNARDHYRAGERITVEDALAQWLMDDAPGSFREHVPEVETKAMVAPPVDKMMAAPPVAKNFDELFPSDVAEMLHESGFTTVAQIQAASDEELLAINGIGPVSLRRIRAAIL